jgi:hypothetical protein
MRQRHALTTIGIVNTSRPVPDAQSGQPHVRWTGSTTPVLIGYDWDHTLEGRDRLYLHWAGDWLGGLSGRQVVDDDGHRRP